MMTEPLLLTAHAPAMLDMTSLPPEDQGQGQTPPQEPARLADSDLDRARAVLNGTASWALIQGDGPAFLRSLPGASVDAVITDPPYPRSFAPLYGAIAAELPRLLKRGGSLLAIVPHYGLPDILADVGKHLKYRWTLCMWQDAGSHPRMAMGIEVMWKPIVWWVNEAWPVGRGFVKDGFVNVPPEKMRHRWEQSLTWAEHCLRVVPAGGVIIDPLCGAGTSGVAAVRRGYRYIGIDNDPAAIVAARMRLEAVAPPSSPGDSST